MDITDEMVERAAQELFRIYHLDPPYHRQRLWRQLSEVEMEDWRFDAARILLSIDGPVDVR